MLSNWSIKQLYPLALAEGEGVGTAYEYYVKRLALRSWLARRPHPKSILMAGLPQRYGSSLDFFLLAEELNAALTIVDERAEGLEKAQHALAAVQATGLMLTCQPTYSQIDSWADLPWQETVFDLTLSSEVLQRLQPQERKAYAAGVQRVSSSYAVFSPNKDNESHVGISGLDGLTSTEMRLLWPQASRSGFIDLPPFPPGITRTEDQREQATSGRFEAFAMWGLGVYAQLEGWVPQAIRRRYAHIVYAFT